MIWLQYKAEEIMFLSQQVVLSMGASMSPCDNVCSNVPVCAFQHFVLTETAYSFVPIRVCVRLAEPCSLSPGKSHRFQSLRGAVKKNAAFLRKACASVCMVQHQFKTYWERDPRYASRLQPLLLSAPIYPDTSSLFSSPSPSIPSRHYSSPCTGISIFFPPPPELLSLSGPWLPLNTVKMVDSCCLPHPILQTYNNIISRPCIQFYINNLSHQRQRIETPVTPHPLLFCVSLLYLQHFMALNFKLCITEMARTSSTGNKERKQRYCFEMKPLFSLIGPQERKRSHLPDLSERTIRGQCHHRRQSSSVVKYDN